MSATSLQQTSPMLTASPTPAKTYACLGRAAEAKHYINELLGLIPRYSLRSLRKNPMFVRPELVEKLIESMRLAGLPE